MNGVTSWADRSCRPKTKSLLPGEVWCTETEIRFDPATSAVFGMFTGPTSAASPPLLAVVSEPIAPSGIP